MLDIYIEKGLVGKYMYLPNKLEKILAGMHFEADKEGMSKAKVIKCFDMDKSYYLKIEKVNDEVIREYEMYQWLYGKLSVPKVIYRVIEDDISYMLIENAKGQMLEDEAYRKTPERLVHLAAIGIKKLQSVDITECNFNSRIEGKLEKAKYRIDHNLIGRVDRNKYTEGLETSRDVFNYLLRNKPVEQLVFTHGDYCFNNYFTDGKDITSFIDLGRAGVGDLYQDIALCVRELMDFDSRYTDMLFEELEIKPDYAKIKYYILLDELF